MDPRFDEILAVLQTYFDGLYHSDTERLGRVFHPQAVYATATPGELLRLDMQHYLPVVDARPAPASRNEARTDRVVSIAFAGPVTAIATVQCSIGPRHFTDLLSLVRLDGEWRIIAKVFDYTEEG